jgi:hypothetical protein
MRQFNFPYFIFDLSFVIARTSAAAIKNDRWKIENGMSDYTEKLSPFC